MYTLHNTWNSFATPTRWLNASTMRRDAADLAVSELVRATVPPRLRARTEVVVHGVDLDGVRGCADRAGARAELGIGPDEIVAGTVANFRAQKDYPNLLAAAVILRDRGVPVRVLAVGQGPLEAEIRAEHHRLGLGDRVVLLGERADAVRVMSACDLFVLASSNEGLPVAVMEALALGLPVVGTAVGGMTEAVDASDGVLVPPRDPRALAHAIAELAAAPAPHRARRGGASRRRSGSTSAGPWRGIEAIYTEVTGPARSTRPGARSAGYRTTGRCLSGYDDGATNQRLDRVARLDVGSHRGPVHEPLVEEERVTRREHRADDRRLAGGRAHGGLGERPRELAPSPAGSTRSKRRGTKSIAGTPVPGPQRESEIQPSTVRIPSPRNAPS